jgi:uncharacterized coiled-coil protein SlyX
MLQSKVIEQQEEIKQLRQHLRNLFDKNEDEIISISYKDADTGQGSVMLE